MVIQVNSYFTSRFYFVLFVVILLFVGHQGFAVTMDLQSPWICGQLGFAVTLELRSPRIRCHRR